MKIDKFVLAILASIGIAYIFPQWGSQDSQVPIDTISILGISLIFFFYGLKLSPQKLRAGLQNWRLHVLVQGATFLLFPLLVLMIHPFIRTQEQEILWLAFFFLAALPSTVSSSVVMVSLAKGNIPAAIFNASISGIIGIAITPLWLGPFVQEAQIDFDFTDIYLKLMLQIILPVALGLLLQRYWGMWAQRHGSRLATFDKSIILLIIYNSFAESFEAKIFSSVSGMDIVIIGVAVLLLFYAAYFLTGFMAHRLRFSTEDRITAQFCGTKKSLVHGTVFSKILFGGLPTLGIILLPLMLFHALQILIMSVIATKMARRAGVPQDG